MVHTWSFFLDVGEVVGKDSISLVLFVYLLMSWKSVSVLKIGLVGGKHVSNESMEMALWNVQRDCEVVCNGSSEHGFIFRPCG